MQRGQFTLAGTLLIDGNNTAYLKEAVGGKQRRVKQGEQINGMTVAEIKPDRVRLTLGDEAEEITLKVATNPRPTPTAAPATTAADTPTPVPDGGGRDAAGRRASRERIRRARPPPRRRARCRRRRADAHRPSARAGIGAPRRPRRPARTPAWADVGEGLSRVRHPVGPARRNK